MCSRLFLFQKFEEAGLASFESSPTAVEDRLFLFDCLFLRHQISDGGAGDVLGDLPLLAVEDGALLAAPVFAWLSRFRLDFRLPGLALLGLVFRQNSVLFLTREKFFEL